MADTDAVVRARREIKLGMFLLLGTPDGVRQRVKVALQPKEHTLK